MKTYIFKTVTTMKEYNNKKWSSQYIDLWVTVLTVIDTDFEEE